METIGLFGGSFNPVHNGHVMLASHLSKTPILDKVWLVLSPQNPLRKDAMVSDEHRLAMLNIALNDVRDVEVCDIELSMPRPSYSIATLDRLKRLHPDKQFRWIIGSDNWLIFHRWHEYIRILDEYGIIVYPRPGYPIEHIEHPNAILIDAPVMDVSSTFIRHGIAEGKNMNQYLPSGVFEYITTHQLYQNE